LGHELDVPNGAERLIDAFRRGRTCSVELIEGMDFFQYANTPLEELRLQWNILPKAIS
jgi:hypothetical protein